MEVSRTHVNVVCHSGSCEEVPQQQWPPTGAGECIYTTKPTASGHQRGARQQQEQEQEQLRASVAPLALGRGPSVGRCFCYGVALTSSEKRGGVQQPRNHPPPPPKTYEIR
jgi:hypothetical protein